MNFNWVGYLNVARHLNEHSGASGYSEACLRAAISRPYYTALITARNLLRDQWGIEVPETAEIHSFILRWFLNEDDENQKENCKIKFCFTERCVMEKEPMLVGWDDGKIYFYINDKEHCVSDEPELLDRIILLCRQSYDQKARRHAGTRIKKIS
jgi:hypothetical protein